MGGNAVLSMRFDSSEIGKSMSEIVAYGTVVVVVDVIATLDPPSQGWLILNRSRYCR